MARRDPSLDTLYTARRRNFVADAAGKCWVKFIVKRVPPTAERPHGIIYSLTLHDENGERLLGFDNAHAIRESAGPGARTRIEYDHKHAGERVRFYEYSTRQHCSRTFGPKWKPSSKEGNLMTTLKVGIATLEQYKKRTLAIARGEYVPAKNEPKVWFQSLETMSQVLSDKNRALLGLIAKTQPQSLTELAEATGRAKSNLSRTLRTMERYGLVHFEEGTGRQLAPRVNYSGVELEMSFQ